MARTELAGEGFSVSFSDREVTAWGGLALLERMLDGIGFREAASGWGLPEPKSNRGYVPLQLIEQFIVSIWCGACRIAHAETVRMDGTLVRLFGWTRAAGHKAIMRLFGRFDMLTNERVQAEVQRWFFGKVGALKQVTLDVDSTVITRNGEQQGAARGYNPNRHGRVSHHPLLAFVAEARMVANFWLRPGNAHSANNLRQFLESTLAHLGDELVGLLRADSGFFDETVLSDLEDKRIAYIVAARLTQPLQRAIWRLVGAGDRAGADRPGRRLEASAAARRGASIGQAQERAGQDAVAVCGRSGPSGLALWRLRHHARSSWGGSLAPLPGTGGL